MATSFNSYTVLEKMAVNNRLVDVAGSLNEDHIITMITEASDVMIKMTD